MVPALRSSRWRLSTTPLERLSGPPTKPHGSHPPASHRYRNIRHLRSCPCNPLRCIAVPCWSRRAPARQTQVEQSGCSVLPTVVVEEAAVSSATLKRWGLLRCRTCCNIRPRRSVRHIRLGCMRSCPATVERWLIRMLRPTAQLRITAQLRTRRSDAELVPCRSGACRAHRARPRPAEGFGRAGWVASTP